MHKNTPSQLASYSPLPPGSNHTSSPKTLPCSNSGAAPGLMFNKGGKLHYIEIYKIYIYLKINIWRWWSPHDKEQIYLKTEEPIEKITAFIFKKYSYTLYSRSATLKGSPFPSCFPLRGLGKGIILFTSVWSPLSPCPDYISCWGWGIFLYTHSQMIHKIPKTDILMPNNPRRALPDSEIVYISQVEF